jgi:ribonuclease BN (tRNA processing enzyme)
MAEKNNMDRMGHTHSGLLSAHEPGRIAEALGKDHHRFLLFGKMGIGKSTLTTGLARVMEKAGRSCFCLGADPGSPAFGVPGGVCLGRWQNNRWHLVAMEALCTLNAGRFRLPLVSAVKRLVRGFDRKLLLVDAPGVTRGIPGTELLLGLVEAASIQTILVLCKDGKELPYAGELIATQARIHRVLPSPLARPPGRGKRTRQRTRLWNAYLQEAKEMRVELSPVSLIGTPPPLEAVKEWQGRQVALLQGETTLTMGEVLKIENNTLRIRAPGMVKAFNQVMIRDACRSKEGELKTARHTASSANTHCVTFQRKASEAGTSPQAVVRMGGLTATLMNGVFGDPLVHLRLMNQKQSMLFDLGNGERLPSRLAHQLTHVFITHAHMDHIGGFLWFLRSRIGDFPPCNIYGPPGLTNHIEGMIHGVHWDRIGESGPRFRVAEHHGDYLQIVGLQAGKKGREILGREQVIDNVLLKTPTFSIQAIMLDHGTPVLAYSFERMPQLNIQRKRLLETGMSPGPWIGELKRVIAAGNRDARILLPDNSMASAGGLADDLLLVSPAYKLVYATDLADTPSNRNRLIRFARNAHTLFCEAAFTQDHKRKAASSGHLTARACGEIARAANVNQVIPFHFSKRYESRPWQIYDEVKSAR